MDDIAQLLLGHAGEETQDHRVERNMEDFEETQDEHFEWDPVGLCSEGTAPTHGGILMTTEVMRQLLTIHGLGHPPEAPLPPRPLTPAQIRAQKLLAKRREQARAQSATLCVAEEPAAPVDLSWIDETEQTPAPKVSKGKKAKKKSRGGPKVGAPCEIREEEMPPTVFEDPSEAGELLVEETEISQDFRAMISHKELEGCSLMDMSEESNSLGASEEASTQFRASMRDELGTSTTEEDTPSLDGKDDVLDMTQETPVASECAESPMPVLKVKAKAKARMSTSHNYNEARPPAAKEKVEKLETSAKRPQKQAPVKQGGVQATAKSAAKPTATNKPVPSAEVAPPAGRAPPLTLPPPVEAPERKHATASSAFAAARLVAPQRWPQAERGAMKKPGVGDSAKPKAWAEMVRSWAKPEDTLPDPETRQPSELPRSEAVAREPQAAAGFDREVSELSIPEAAKTLHRAVTSGGPLCTGIILRVRGTFIEAAIEVGSEESWPLMRRSKSDGELGLLKQAMDDGTCLG